MKNYLQISVCWFLLLITNAVFCQATLVTDPPNGHYCQGANPAGVQILIENSNPGTMYFLKRQGQPGNLAQVQGNGDTVTFNGYYGAGQSPWVYYTVPETNTVTVTRDPQPEAFEVTISNDGYYCTYPGAQGVEIGIDGSTPGVEYSLYQGVLQVGQISGNGSPRSFGFYATAGTYHVIAEIPATGCTRNLGSVTVTPTEPPTADFSAAPQNQCASIPVEFTDESVVNYPGAELVEWQWDFDDPNSGVNNTSTDPNPSHIFEAWGNGFQTFNVNLKVTDSYGCEDEISKPVTVKQKPDATLHAYGPGISTKIVGDIITFAYCGPETSVLFTFENQSTTLISNSWYHIDWGDGTPPFDSQTFNAPIQHQYNGLGFKTLTYTITGDNGCDHIKEYYIFVGSTPSGGLVNPGNTAGNSPFAVYIPLQLPETHNNTPGTTYELNFGDGSPIEYYTQEQINQLDGWDHTYVNCSNSLYSCNGDDYYGFVTTLKISNPCFTLTTSVCPIIVSCPVQPNFGGGGGGGGGGGNWGAGQGEIMACNPVTFSNETIPGFYITGNGTTFTQQTFYEWDFGDPDSGAANSSNDPNPTHAFTNSCQSYIVTLTAYTGEDPFNNSGFVVITNEVFIQENPVADFEMDDSGNNCVPKEVQMINTSIIGCFGVPDYLWTVEPALGWQITTPGFLNDPTYENPLFQFNVSGTYSVTLTITNSCGSDEITKTVLVCEPPEVAFDDDEWYYCGPGPRDFSEVNVPTYLENCEPPITYLWEVTGPEPVGFVSSTASTSKYPVINFPVNGTYSITLTITNSCGNDVATQIVHVTNALDNNIISTETPEVCSGDTPIVIDGTLPTGGTGSFTYIWWKYTLLNPNWTQIIPNVTTQNLELANPLTETTWFRRWAYDSGDCSSVSNEIEITVYPAIVNNLIVANQIICQGNAPELLTGTTAFGGNEPMTYQWYESTDGIDWNEILGAVDLDYQPGTLTQTTYFKRAAISDPCQPDYSMHVNITVCDPITLNSISEDQTICQGTQPELLTGTEPSGACGAFTYQWQIATDTNPIFADIPQENDQNYQPPAINVKTYFRRVVLSQMCLDNISNVVTIEIYPIPNVNAGMDQVISSGMNTTLNGTVSGGTPPYTSYTWEPAGKIASGGNTLNATTENLDATTIFSLTAIDSNGCVGTDNITVFVEGDPLSVTIDPALIQICPGQSVENLCAEPAGGTGNYQFSWNSSPPGFFSNVQCISVTPPTSTSYNVVVFDGYSTATASVVVEVLPVPVVTSLLDITICSNTQLNYEPTSTIAGSTFQWITTPGGSCTGNSSGQGTIIEDLLINNGVNDCVITYEIIPFGPIPPNCGGLPVALNVTVKSVPYVTNTISQQTIISGQLTEPVTFTSNIPEAVFEWEFFETDCEGFLDYPLVSGTEATIPSQIITILEGGPSQCYLTYRVTPSLNIPGDSCPGVHFDYTFIINLEPQSYTMICPEPICAGESVNVSLSGSELGVEYLLLRNGAIPIPPAKPGTGGQLDWENISIAGSYSIRATNLSNGQSSMMNGVCQVVVNPNPITFQLSALENEHCAPVTPLLSGSELYVDYELWLDETSILQTKAGTGNSELFYFDPVNDPGIYTVRAHDPFTGCSHWMSGSIIVDPSPQEFSIFPEGTLCEGVQLCIDGCEPGVEYQLWKDDDPFGPYFVGTASSTFICFPPTDGPGVYRVYARFIDTFCDRFFSDDQIVHENPLIYNLSPPSGCPGTEIFLDGCQEGIEYELWFDPPAKKSKNQKGWVITKTCDPNYQTLNFGQCWDEGTYTVKAVNPLTNCVSWMDDQTTIQAAPAIFNLVPNGIGCASQTLSLDGSETGVKYLLYQNGQLIDSVTGLATGTITFSTYSDIGIYTAKAKFDEMNGALPCWSDMNGSYEIISYPTAFTLSPLPGIYCPPLNAELSSSQIGINYYLENTTNGIEYGPFPGTGSTLTFPPINDPGEYQCNARHPDYPSCDKQMIGGFTISLPPLVYNLSGPLPSQYCQGNPGVTLTLENSQDGVEYQLYKLNPQLAIGLPQTGQSGESLEWTNITSGTYKVTAYFSTDPNCPMDMNNNVEVEEIANPTVFAGMDETICFSESYTVNDAQITDVSDFEWIILSGYGQLDNASVISPTYTPEDGDQGTTVALKLVAQGIQACSNLTAEDIVEIHFDPLPLVNAGEDNTICFNGSYTLADVTMTNVSEFIWTVFQGWGTLDDNTAVNPTYTPGLGDENMDVILRLEANGVLACISEVAQDDIIIHINPVPEIISPSQKIICSGESVNYLPESNINGTIFSWTSLNNTGGCITGNTTSSEGIIEDILVNDCKSVQFIKYSITPTGPPMTNCTGEEFELLVYINPLANVTNTENEQSINSNETTQSVSFQSDIIGSVVSFTWTGVASVPELENWITNGSGELPSMNIWIDDNGPTPPEYGSITYTVVPWVNGCEGNPFTYTIHVYLLPSVYQLSIEGGGEFCDDGINCINIYLSDSQIDKIYKVFLDNVYLPDYDKQGTNNGLEWCVNQSGEYMVQAFNPNTGVEIWMNGSAEVFARDLPENYTLSIVSPDDNCVPVSFKLEGSQPEAKYDLYFEYDGITQIAQPDVQGTGMTIYFNEQENAGNYYVVARIEYTEITCEKQMSGIITVSPLPEEYDLVTNSNFCTGQDSICMINSDTNVVYQLYKGPVAYGAEIQGTGEELCFGTISETGTYSILAKNIITLCERIFEQQVDVYPLPVKFSMSPDSACSGAEILLNNCQENIDYYLYWQPDSQEVYRESILVSGPLSCTVSSTLSFGVWENSGIYKIKAVNEFDCENWMDNSTVILPNPSTFEIQPQGFIGCEPVTVYLDYFENDVIYYLWRQDIQGNNHLMATGYGTNGPIIFGVQSEPGIYSVKAKRSRGTFNCFADMNGSLTIGIPPEIYTLKPVNDSCPPVGFYLSESQENVVYQLWSQSAGMLQEKQGLGNPVYFDLIDDPDDYYVLAINEIGCEIQMEGTRTILEPPSGYDVILTDGNICIDENPQIGLNWSDVGVTYELNRIAASYNPVAIANGQDAPLTFTPTFELEAGDYKVKAIDDVNSCEMWMNNTVTLFNPPDIYDITANGYVSQSGHFCPPVDIGLSFSQPAIIYSLIKEGITLSFLVGDGNSLSFGSFFEPGVYTITALNLETTCNSEMNGSVTISDGPAPYELTTENPLFCYGDQNAVTLILIDSQEGVDYQLYKNDLTNPVLEVKPGTNSALIWDSVSQFGEGNYFVVGKFPDDPECETTMINTIELIELSLPTAEINGDTVICETYCTQIPVLLTGEILNWQLTYEVNGEILSKTFTITEPHFLDICPIGTVTTTVNLIEIKYADAPACIGVVTGVYNVSIQPLPEANAGNNATVCESEEIYYIDEAEAFNFSSLNWNIEGIGSLNYTNVLNPLYLIPDISDPAIVTFTLTVFGMGDCSNENVSSTFTLSINPLPDVFAGENFTVCESEEQVMMSVASATYFTDLNWSADIGFFDNPSDLHPNYLIPDVSELTIVEIVLAATGTGECSENTVTSSFTLSINPLPDVFAGENFTVCESEEQVMMSVASATYFTDLNWSADIGSFDNPSDLHPNYLIPDVSEPTFVEIVLAATGTGECAENTVTSSFTLSINPLPDVFAGENFTVCESEEQVMMSVASATYFTDLNWSANIGSFDNPSDLHPNYLIPDISEPTSADIVLSVIGTGECTGQVVSSSFTLQIDPIPIIYAGCNDTICESQEEYTLIDATADHYSEVHWEVNGIGGFVNPDVINPVYLVPNITDPLDVELIMTVIGIGTCSDIAVVTSVFVHITPMPNIVAGSDATICESAEFYDFNGASAEYYSELSWSVNGIGVLNDSTLLQPQYIIPDISEPSCVTFTLTAFGTGKCENDFSTSSFTLHIIPLPIVYAGSDTIVCQASETFLLSGATAQFYSGVSWSAQIGSFSNTYALNTSYLIPEVNETTIVELILTAYGDGVCFGDSVTSSFFMQIDPLPQIFAGNPASVCVADSYRILDATADYCESISWSLPEGLGSLDYPDRIDPIYTPSPEAAGTIVTLTLTAISTGTCIGIPVTDFVIVTVDRLPIVEAGNGGVVCYDFESTNFYTIPEGEASVNYSNNFEWSIDTSMLDYGYIEGLSTLTPTFIPYPPASGKTVILHLTATGHETCNNHQISDSRQIKVGSIPYVLFEIVENNEDSSLCCCAPAYFNDLTFFGNQFPQHPDQIISQRIWNFGDGTGDFAYVDKTVVDHTFTDPGTYLVTLQIETMIDNITICSNTFSAEVTINTLPIADFSSKQVNYCNGTVEFYDQSSGNNTIDKFWWKFEDGITSYYSDIQNPVFEYLTPGIKTVTFTVTDHNGCYNTVEKVIKIEDFFNFEINHDGQCPDDVFKFWVDTATILPQGNGIELYNWSFGDGSSIVQDSLALHTFENYGTQTIMLIATDSSGCEKSKYYTIEIPGRLESEFTHTECEETIDFTDRSNTNGNTIDYWIWDFGDGTTDTVWAPDDPNISHLYPEHKSYAVSLTIRDSFGCESMYFVDSVRTICFEIKGLYVPNAFAPVENNPNEFNLFKPKGINLRTYHIAVFDLWGNLLWESDKLDENGSPTEAWDGKYKNDLVPPGVYLWKILAEFLDGTVWFENPDQENDDGNKGISTGTVVVIR